MNYTLHQLQVFLKVTQLKSITKAADELFLTQPAVSIQLKNFQDQFEIPLTEIIGRKLFVTDFGIEIALAAENILNEVYAINYKTMAYKGQLFGRLKISIVSTAKYIMPYFLSDFMKSHDQIELLLDVTNKSKVLESLEKNEIDFAMVSVLPTTLQIEKLDLMQNKLFLIGKSKHGFDNNLYDASVFENIPLIYREQGSGTRFAMEQFVKENNLPVHKKMELTSNEAVKQSVLAGLGFSIMPIIGIKNQLENNELQIIPVEKFPIISNWYLIWQKNKKFTPLAQSYLDFVIENKNKIVNDNFKWVEKF
jgi:LysR family transcriptional regulator, low CO2-responsive transcriptional regulator